MFCIGFSTLFPLAPEGLAGLETEPTWMQRESQFWAPLSMEAEMPMVSWRNRHEKKKQQQTLNRLFCVGFLLVNLSYLCLSQEK